MQEIEKDTIFALIDSSKYKSDASETTILNKILSQRET